MPFKDRAKRLEFQRKYYHASPQRRRAYLATIRFGRWKRTYNISKSEWFALLEKQGNVCAACGEAFIDGFGSLKNPDKMSLVASIDHDRKCCPHEGSCGKCIRGIVHLRCNRLMGLLKDNPSLLVLCAGYLQRWRKTHP